MRIKLIKPAETPRSGVLLNKTTLCMDAALPLLAALTPPQHQVTLVDESFAPDARDVDVDVVGISVWTDLALRAYAIAEHYRSRGAIVVMGGIHPTMCPDEVQMHCDAVVVGEGDQSWPTLLADIERGALRRGGPAAPQARSVSSTHPMESRAASCWHRGEPRVSLRLRVLLGARGPGPSLPAPAGGRDCRGDRRHRSPEPGLCGRQYRPRSQAGEGALSAHDRHGKGVGGRR
ncbi:MAG: cobalamin-dependent protein [Deltaproteobacteria bacterium]|nr:cobalamin-dependent protein [Deltaproteobacteria bacterium]